DLPGVWIPSSGEPPAKWESARGSSRAVDSRSGDADSASAVAAAAVCTDRATVSGDGVAVCRVRPLCWGLQSRKEHSGADAASMAALVRLSAAARTLSAYSASFLPEAPPGPCLSIPHRSFHPLHLLCLAFPKHRQHPLSATASPSVSGTGLLATGRGPQVRWSPPVP
ncbi:MAG: hypothetical protein ACPIOQ_28690, partial [Promethearchaeia archaeon]